MNILIYKYAYRFPEYSIHQKVFAFTCMWKAAILHSTAQPMGWGAYIYIVIHRQTVSLYHDLSVWLDT